VIAVDCGEINGFGNGLTFEEVTVGPKALFPLPRVLNLRRDDDLRHVFSPSVSATSA
jgi:hypothetical protein